MAKQAQEDSQLEHDDHWIEYIFPINMLSKSKLKQLKIPPREREGCQLVCVACCKALRSLHSARSHASNDVHKAKVKEKWLDLLLPDLPPPPLAPHHLQALDHFVESLFREQSASVQGQGEVRAGIAAELQGLVQRTFQGVTVELFGSSVSGFALVSSNVNLNLNIPGAQEKQVLIPPVMKGVLEIIRCNTETYCEVQEDFFAFNKIPRILFMHKASGLKCEIRAVVGNPMALSHLLGLYGSLDERALKLAVLFRHWAKVCKVDQQEDGHYPGHMFIIMVIHYLQQRHPQVLPVLHELKAPAEASDSAHSSEKSVDPTAICYLDDRSLILEKWKCCNTETVGELWYGLLRYYTLEFKMSEHAVTIRQLDPLLRSERQWGGTRLTVEDPLIPRSNLGRAASSEKVYSYMMSSLKQTLLYFGNPTPADLFSKDNISRLLAKQGDRSAEVPGGVAEKKVTSSRQAEVHHVRKNDTKVEIPDTATPAEPEATSPHEIQLVGQSEISGEAVHFSKPDDIEVNKSLESNLGEKKLPTACDASALSSKSEKGFTGSIELEAQAQQGTIPNTPGMSLKRLATEEKYESIIGTTTPAEAEAASPHEIQLVGQGGINGEAMHFSKPDGTKASNSQGSNLEGKTHQPACDTSDLSSKSVKGCKDGIELEGQAQQSVIHVKPNTPEMSVNRLAVKEKSESGTKQSDDSVVFVAFSHEQCPTVATNTKPNEFEISFMNESQLSEQPDDHKQGDLKHKPQVPAAEGLPSDLKFGSFSDESSSGQGEKAIEEVDVVPTKGQGHAQQNIHDATDPQLQPSLQENVNSSLHKETLHSSLRTKNVDSLLHTQSTCANRETVDSSDPGIYDRDENVNMTSEKTSTLQSMENAMSSSEVISIPKPALSDSTTTTSRYSFHISNFVFHPYPKACLNCKKMNHIAVDCPTDDLPELMKLMPKHGPGWHSLRAMESAFKNHMNSVIPRQSHFQMRKDMCDYILADIKKIYPNARLQLFGSSANGFGSFKSDLDICMTLEGDAEFESSSVIQAVADELHKHREKYQYILPITHARVPIVKFYLSKWRLQCDISLENQLALRNTRMLAAYASIDERVQLLGYAIKHMAKMCDMGDAASGSLSSYAYILLLLHYLQRTDPPVVPVLQEIFPSDTGRCAGPYIQTWNCYYYEFQSKEELIKVWPWYHKNMQPVGELWLGFLRYFLRFDWSTEVVAIRQMDPVTKFDKWWMSKCMCIEDPFNLEHNLAGGITGKMKTYILERFSAALSYHSENILWMSMHHMMDGEALIGDSRSPKFIVCILCNGRGHKAQQCSLKSKKSKPKPAKQEDEKKMKEATGSTISSSPMVVQTSKSSGGILRLPQKSKGDPSQKSEQLSKKGDINKESRNAKKRQNSARVPGVVGQEPHPQRVSNTPPMVVEIPCDPIIAPQIGHSSVITPNSAYSSIITPHSGHSSVTTPESGHSSVITPQSGHSSIITPHSAYSSIITPESGHSSAITPQSGHSSAITPESGHSSIITPHSGHSSAITPESGHSSVITPESAHSSVITPQSGHSSVITPQSSHSSIITPHSAYSSIITPQSGHSSVVTPHRGHPSTAFCFSPPLSIPTPNRLPFQAVYTRSPFPDPRHATPSGSFPYSASPTTPTQPIAHPSALQDWHSPAFSPLQPTQQVTHRDFSWHQSVPLPHIYTRPTQEFLYQGHSVPFPGTGSPSPLQPTPEMQMQFQHPSPTPTNISHTARNRRSHGNHDKHTKGRHSNTGQKYPK